jgi:adenylate cyclase
VLFADVVHSMDIAASVGAERLREIMAELVDRSTAVVRRYSGSVDRFTGDGIMAVFGAPMALEDHAFRACLAALEIQVQTAKLAAEVKGCDGIDLKLRIGLNSGQVIVGEIGSSTTSYTAIGEQVGMAQRMESVAPPGGVMLSEPTARLVENIVVLDEPELVHIKGVHTAVPARRLLSIGEHQPRRRSESALVGRTGELNTVGAILKEVIGGTGCVVNMTGPAGIGKSRLVRETAAIAASCGVPVFTAYCESHTRDVQFHVVARLLRAGMGISDLDGGAARTPVHDRLPDADGEDMLLLEDLLGIADTTVARPDIAPEARRRRAVTLFSSPMDTNEVAIGADKSRGRKTRSVAATCSTAAGAAAALCRISRPTADDLQICQFFAADVCLGSCWAGRCWARVRKASMGEASWSLVKTWIPTWLAPASKCSLSRW